MEGGPAAAGPEADLESGQRVQKEGTLYRAWSTLVARIGLAAPEQLQVYLCLL